MEHTPFGSVIYVECFMFLRLDARMMYAMHDNNIQADFKTPPVVLPQSASGGVRPDVNLLYTVGQVCQDSEHGPR